MSKLIRFYGFQLLLLVSMLISSVPLLGSGYNLYQSITYGGSGGCAYDSYHDPTEWGKIRRISVRSGFYVDAIEFVYANGRTFRCGGGGGRESIIDLDRDEFIKRVDLKFGYYIDQITFISNKKVYGPFGGNGGGPVQQISFNGFALQGIFGRSGVYLDQIGFYYGEQVNLGSEIIKTICYGGGGGGLFDDLEHSTVLEKISAIKIQAGCLVDNINTSYGDRVEEFPHGGGGGEAGGLSSG